MGTFTDGIIKEGTGALGSIVNAGLGLALGAYNDRRQIKQQQRLQDQQIAGQQQMALFNQGLQKGMWESTNYEEQKRHMEQAGLNPGLMYGMGGGGGVTTGSANGNVTGGQAPSGGGEAMAMMQMGLQKQMMEAQIELAKAQANKTNVEAGNISEGGIDYRFKEGQLNLTNEQTKTEKGKQGLLEVQNIAQGLANQLAARTQNDQVKIVEKTIEEIDQRIGKLMAEGEIVRTQAKNLQRQIDTQIILQTAQTNLANSGVKVNEATVKEIANSIAQKWFQLRQGDESLWQGKQQLQINKGQLELGGKRLDFDKEIHNVTDKTKMTVESAMKLVQSIINVVDIL